MVSGCGNNADVVEGPAVSAIGDAPLYSRSVSQIKLVEGYNPYMMEFSEQGVFYYVQETIEEGEDFGTGYHFYFQTYEGENITSICTLKSGYIRDFSVIKKDNSQQLAILQIGEQAKILVYDLQGTLVMDTPLASDFNEISAFPNLLALSGGDYIIGMNKMLYRLNEQGNVIETIAIEGTLREIVLGDSVPCIIYEKLVADKTEVFISEIDFSRKCIGRTRKLPGEYAMVTTFGTSELTTYSDEGIYLFDLGELNNDNTENSDLGELQDETLVDLRKQGILASQLQYIFGCKEEVRLISMDMTQEDPTITLFTLIPMQETSKSEADALEYAPDGRRIIAVAVPWEYRWQIEFHADKYNQTSDDSFVKIDRFEGALEDYLGKGNRPDIVMLEDQTAISGFVDRGLLVDIIPFFEGQEQYLLSDILPMARNILGADDGMYAMAGDFQLLLRTSNREEFDEQGKCTTISYLKWYDKYLRENEVEGSGDLSNLLLADICLFYDESNGDAYFISNEFKNLMQEYKDVISKHQGELEKGLINKRGITIGSISRGGMWLSSLRNAWMLGDPGNTLVGLPTDDGNSVVWATVQYPLAIMNTSEEKEKAFDFIMYYGTLKEYLLQGDSANEYGNGYLTPATFSTSEKVLDELIFEVETPFAATRNGTEVKFHYFTDQHKNMLLELIDSAQGITRIQKDIYNMVIEEMDGYFQGEKKLDSCCEILQSRVKLYLAERQ